MKGIILAAGIGERMRPLTDDLPKPMLPINNKPALHYLVSLFNQHGIKEIAMTTFHLKEKITEYFKSGREFGMKIFYLDEHELIPSGRALRYLLDFVEDQVIVMNGDSCTDLDLKELVKFHQAKGADITIVSYLRESTSGPSSQLDFDKENKLLKFKEKLTLDEMNLIPNDKRNANAGIYIFNKKAIESIPHDEERDLGKIFPDLLEKNNVFVYPIGKAYFKEFGKIEKYDLVKKEIESGKVKLDINLIEKRKFLTIGNKNREKLELGSGGRPTPGYMSQDITPLPGVELDFTCNPWEIPLSENSLSEVIALGLVEHLRYNEVKATLKHMCSLLKKGGSFSFDVPDMRIWSRYLYNLTNNAQNKNIFRPEHVWSTIYGWQRWPGDEHKSGWTREEIIKTVKDIGFSEIEEGPDIFISKGIERGRFSRYGDAHVYIKAIK